MNRNITALILVIISIGIYVTITQGIIVQAEAVKSVNDQYSSAIANATRLIAVRDQVLQQYNSISDNDKARLDKMIPSTVDNIRLMIDLNSVASRHGLALTNVQATVPPVAAAPAITPVATGQAAGLPGGATAGQTLNAPTLGTVSVTFGVTATYQQFQSFLQDLEADLRIMDLTHLNISANDSGIYTFNVTFQTYWVHQ